MGSDFEKDIFCSFDNLLCNFERENNLVGFLVTSFDVMHFTKAFSLFSKVVLSQYSGHNFSYLC